MSSNCDLYDPKEHLRWIDAGGVPQDDVQCTRVNIFQQCYYICLIQSSGDDCGKLCHGVDMIKTSAAAWKEDQESWKAREQHHVPPVHRNQMGINSLKFMSVQKSKKQLTIVIVQKCVVEVVRNFIQTNSCLQSDLPYSSICVVQGLLESHEVLRRYHALSLMNSGTEANLQKECRLLMEAMLCLYEDGIAINGRSEQQPGAETLILCDPCQEGYIQPTLPHLIRKCNAIIASSSSSCRWSYAHIAQCQEVISIRYSQHQLPLEYFYLIQAVYCMQDRLRINLITSAMIISSLIHALSSTRSAFLRLSLSSDASPKLINCHSNEEHSVVSPRSCSVSKASFKSALLSISHRCINDGSITSSRHLRASHSRTSASITDTTSKNVPSKEHRAGITSPLLRIFCFITILLSSLRNYCSKSFHNMAALSSVIGKLQFGKSLKFIFVSMMLLGLSEPCRSLHIDSSSPIDPSTLMYSDFSYPVSNQRKISVGLILPFSVFSHRTYRQNIIVALKHFPSGIGTYNFSFEDIKQEMFKLTPSPKAILDTLCDKFLPQNVSAILYVTKDETYGRNTASSQYFLQLAGYLGIPVIAWNADNSGLEQASQTGLILQLAPSIHHQAHAMLSILVQYSWHAFTIITTRIAGHKDFTETIREKVEKFRDPTDTSTANFKFTIIDAITVENPEIDLLKVKNSEARILLLYSTRVEGESIMLAANKLGLTGKNYVWVAAQSIIGDNLEGRMAFPVGMLGVHYETDNKAMHGAIVKTIRTFAYGVQSFLEDPRNAHFNLIPNISCQGDAGAKWDSGLHFYRYLNNVTIGYGNFFEDSDNKGERPEVRFDLDGNRLDVELKIMNLRDTTGGTDRVWEEIGTWRSWETDGLNVNDIVWPGNKHVPPEGVPEKFHLRISFMDEPPYISLTPPDPSTRLCNANSGVKCYVSPRNPPSGAMNETTKNNETAHFMCCSGFCIDLLKKFTQDLVFTYELVQVEDKKWGTMEGTKWNGLIADLLNDKADMALSSFKINSERENVVDFTVPFLESGISIVVAKRTGIISPTAFLEPFDTASWMLVAFVAIQVAALTIFLFEWLSPEGYNMKVAPPRDHKFSLLRTYWLVWAVLFQAAVHVDCPKGFTARFMANIWAMFAVVFLAIYTANLAAFMITREEYHDLSGVDDQRLTNPWMSKPPFKFGTVPYTNSDSVFAKHLPKMYSYMNQYNKSHPTLGIQATKKGQLDAFIYDATVLNYLVGQDEECRLLTVGSWYHMTGYGIAFRRGSKHTANFNKKLMEYKNNGDIERLQKFWLHGACRPKKNYKRASEPLALEQFLSAYLLLVSGVVLALLLLLLEHVYFKYLRKHLAKKDSGGCCALISLSMGKSLTFRGAVYEATDKLRRHRCRDPLCQTHILKVKYELDRARVKIRQLEKELESHGVKPSKKYATRGSSSGSLLNACWRPVQEEDDDMVIHPSPPNFPNIMSSLSSARGSSVGGDLPLTTSTSSNPNTPTPSTARDLLNIRDMTKNHISTNDPNRKSLYIQTAGGILPHKSGTSAHLTSLSPTDMDVSPPGMIPHQTTSTTSLVYTDNADLYSRVQGTPGTRHRASMVDMREFAEMETVL